MRLRLQTGRFAAVLYAGLVLLLTATVLVSSLGWVERIFPGFFVMDNRVVPSIGLPHWSITRDGASLFQHQVLAIDGVPASTATEIYARVAAAPMGTHRYEMWEATRVGTHSLDSMRFTFGDWVSVFGALLLNGVIFTAVGMLVWLLGPAVPARAGTMAVMLNLGLFCLTAMDLYGPARLFRLHVATEALIVPNLLHLALVFPVARLGVLRRRVLLVAYALTGGWIVTYQWWLYEPSVYSHIHNLSMLGAGVVGVGLILSSLQAYFTSTSLLVRKRLGIVALGMITGLALPAWLLTASGFRGGEAPINVAAFTAFIFPLSLAYAVLKHDLFEIDALLRRATSYLVLTVIVAGAYAAMAFVVGAALQSTNAAQSAAFPVVFSLIMVVVLIPLRDRVQRVVDRLYHRTDHDAQSTLQRASGDLVATLDLDGISNLAIETVCGSLIVRDVSLWFRGAGGDYLLAVSAGDLGSFRGPLAAGHPLVARLRSGVKVVSTYDRDADTLPTDEEQHRARTLRDLGAVLVLPLGSSDPIGFLAIGPKESGRMFTLDDVNFLATFANQVAVAILNARSYRQVEELNVGLEQKVAQRTRELAETNGELATSLREREVAYQELQQSHESLVRAEKMATVGRLTAGIAHEVNTPLGAILNGLRTLEEFVEEYTASIGDPTVTVEDHRALGDDLATTIRNLTSWTNKAAGYIRTVKAHTRNLDRTEECAFDLSRLIDDTRLLLEHQLRHAACQLTVDCPGDVTLFGDPGKLGQVLTNLLANAIDAYEGSDVNDGPIRLLVQPGPQGVTIAVEDDGAGIAPELRERIFDELFTTKPSGRGTGLGLPISRAIVAKCFDGTLELSSELRRGSRFTIMLPHRHPAEPRIHARA